MSAAAPSSLANYLKLKNKNDTISEEGTSSKRRYIIRRFKVRRKITTKDMLPSQAYDEKIDSVHKNEGFKINYPKFFKTRKLRYAGP